MSEANVKESPEPSSDVLKGDSVETSIRLTDEPVHVIVYNAVSQIGLTVY